MSSTTDETDSQQTGHNRMRFAFIVCVVAVCLIVCYVLLSAPLLSYSIHHPGSSTNGMVNSYIQPLVRLDAFLMQDVSMGEAISQEPLHRKLLYSYYSLWGSAVNEKFMWLQLENWLKSDAGQRMLKSLEHEQVILHDPEGPD